MDDIRNENNADFLQVSLGSAEYTLAPGTSAEIEIRLVNHGPTGDYFVANLLGIPPNWIVNSGALVVWVGAGGQEKMTITLCPPAIAEGIVGPYPGRLYVFSQRAPEKGKELGVLVTVLPQEKPALEKVEQEITKEAILIHVKNELAAAPGKDIEVPLSISNHSEDTHFLELTVEGVPVNWISLPSPAITLFASEEKTVRLILHIPPSAEIPDGLFTLKISAASQQAPEVKAGVEVKLGIYSFESEGRIGVMLRAVQFSVTPGETLEIPLMIVNRGLDADTFQLGIEGIPTSWVSTSKPVVPLRPGESQDLTILVSPSLAPSSRAGRHKFDIVVKSQASPEGIVKVDCLLTVAPFVQFRAELEPRQVDAGKPARVRVQNDGNMQQIFHLACMSQNDALSFEFLPPEVDTASAIPQDETTGADVQPDAHPTSRAPASPTTPGVTASDPCVIPIEAGASAAFRFSAQPNKRPIIGGAVPYPYQVSVESSHKSSPVMPGQVIGHALIPIWVLPVTLVVFLCLAIFSLYPPLKAGLSGGSGTQTAAAGTALAAAIAQTPAGIPTATVDATQEDTDGDGLTYQQEAELQTDPANPDTDNDRLTDGEEVASRGTNPLLQDTDADGLLDGDEVQVGTDPLNLDTDGDNSRDGDEIRAGTHPLGPDSDNDGLLDGQENQECPNALNPDSDKDGVVDGKDLDPCNPVNPLLTALAPTAVPTSLPPTEIVQPTEAAPTAPPEATPEPTATPEAPPAPEPPRLSGTILFTSNRDGNSELYALNTADFTQSRVTNNPAEDTQAAWSPSGQQVAFVTNRDGNYEIYVANSDGSSLANLTNNPADDVTPVWSPDGNWIAFTTNRDGNQEIYVMKSDGTEPRNVTSNQANDVEPAWVDSSGLLGTDEWILFTSERDGNKEVYRVRPDGSEPDNLTNSGANDYSPAGKGSEIAFVSERDGNPEIYVMKLDGSSPVNLTNNPMRDLDPTFRPGDNWIAFSSDRDGYLNIFVIQTDGQGVYNLARTQAEDTFPSWR